MTPSTNTVKFAQMHRPGAALALAALCLALAFAAPACGSDADHATAASLPSIRSAPAFAFTNAEGRSVSNADLAGKVYIAYFFFTSCGGPCPVLNANAAKLQAEFAGLSDFRIVGFTVDPDTDTPERLARYGARYGAKVDRWIYLRNAKDTVAALASAGFLMGDASTPAMHSTRFALVDRKGMIRGYYDGLDEQRLDALRAAIRALEKEAHA